MLPIKRSVRTRFLSCCLLLLLAVGSYASTVPTISKIDPPNWWVGLPNPLLLLTGNELSDASVTTDSKDISITRVQPSGRGHYLFIWLDTSHARPQKVSLTVGSPAGRTAFSFPLQAKTKAQGFQGFGQDDVIYLIMPDRFADGDPSNDQPPASTGIYDRAQPRAYHGGDLRGIREHLPYLHDLGVTAIWLTPIWKSASSDYHGYHPVDFYATDDRMGSLQEYEDLVAEAHKLGIKVLIDYVVNHTGPEHPWVRQPPSPSWFHGTPEKHLAPLYNFSTLTDPHATEDEKRNVLEGWFVDRLPDLNTDDPVVAEYLLDNAMWWTESAHLDGLRLDTFPYSSRRFWSGWLQRFNETYPQVNSVGEVSDNDVTIASFFDGGRTQFDGIDTHVSTIFDYPLYYALHDVILLGQPVRRLIDVLQRDWLYAHPETLVTFFGNHDKPRFAGEANSSIEKLKAAFALVLTLRGIPEIYYGDEIGMKGGDDPENRRDFPGGFPGDTRNAFVASGRTAEEQQVFHCVQDLLRLRQAHPALRHGAQWHVSWDDTYYAFVRQSSEERLLVIFNNAATPRDIPITTESEALQGTHQLDKIFGEGQAQGKDGGWLVSVPATSVSVYQVK